MLFRRRRMCSPLHQTSNLCHTNHRMYIPLDLLVHVAYFTWLYTHYSGFPLILYCSFELDTLQHIFHLLSIGFLKVFSKYGSPWQAPTADFSIRSRMFYATELTDYMERMMIVEITPQVWTTRILPLNCTRINYLPACQPRVTER